MAGEMTFSKSDLYPGASIWETSTEVVPDAKDKEILVEDAGEAVQADKTTASGKYILIAVLVMVAVVVFLGSGD